MRDSTTAETKLTTTADAEAFAATLDQRAGPPLPDVPKRHAPAPDVGIDLVLNPAPPIGVGQNDTLRLDQANAVLGAYLFDAEDPAVAVGHAPSDRLQCLAFPP